MSNKPMPQQIYRHFKGNLYRIVTLAEHTETGEELVIYQALYGDYRVYARELSMFLEKVDKEKYPQAQQEHRFEPVEEILQPFSSGKAVQQTEGKHSTEQSIRQEQSVPQEEHILQEEKIRQDKDAFRESGAAAENEKEELNIDPLVLDFLDAGSYEERLNILASLHPRITDEMINTMAVSVDLEIEEGDVQKRYEELKNCLLTLEKFECNRLR